MSHVNPNGAAPPITVEYVNGRFPFRPGPLFSENITAEITLPDEEGRIRLRLDDAGNPNHADFWLEIWRRCNVSAIVPSLPATESDHDD